MAVSIKAQAAACNMATMISWEISGGPVADAQGVCITYIAPDATRKVLPNSMPFPGETGTTQPSNVWPIQQPGRYFHFFPPKGAGHYEVTLMVGKPGSLAPLMGVVGVTNEVTVTTQLTQYLGACFNWGILSTQKISAWIEANCPKGALESVAAGQLAAHEVDGTQLLIDPDKTGSVFGPLIKACSTPGNELREALAAGLIEFAMGPLKRAVAEGGHVYDASYEVTDQQWIDFLTANPEALSIIIADIGKGKNENANALAALQATVAEVINRKTKSDFDTPHNKSQARADKNKTAVEFLLGADNKTVSGWTGQVSNAASVLNSTVSAQAIAYWQALKTDTENGATQGPALRQFCNKFQPEVTLPDGTKIQLIFAPNNLSQDRPKEGWTPGMGYINDIVDGLEDGDIVVGNAFITGHPGMPDMLAAAKIAKPGIIMKIAVSDKSTLPKQMPPTADGEEPVFVVAQPIKKAFANLLPEILGLPGAHAYIHSKCLCFYKAKTKTWIVITGSHNLGEKADCNNDDTMMAVIGCALFGLAYFVNNLSVYNHFLFRERVNSGAITGYLVTDGSWQTLSAAQTTELQAIMGALASGVGLTPPVVAPPADAGNQGGDDSPAPAPAPAPVPTPAPTRKRKRKSPSKGKCRCGSGKKTKRKTGSKPCKKPSPTRRKKKTTAKK